MIHGNGLYVYVAMYACIVYSSTVASLGFFFRTYIKFFLMLKHEFFLKDCRSYLSFFFSPPKFCKFLISNLKLCYEITVFVLHRVNLFHHIFFHFTEWSCLFFTMRVKTVCNTTIFSPNLANHVQVFINYQRMF